jgi:hypothetical protein
MNTSIPSKAHSLFIVAALCVAASSSATASVVNGSFESGFAGWTATGDWDIQPGGPGAGPTPWGWFSGGAHDGSLYAECGYNGNESTGTLLSSLTVADSRYLNFWHSSNLSPVYSRGTASILSADMTVLGSMMPLGNNDSVWREWTFDLQALGLSAGDQFYFRYSNDASWSVIDDITTSGPSLAAVPEPASLSVGVLCMASAFIRRRRKI